MPSLSKTLDFKGKAIITYADLYQNKIYQKFFEKASNFFERRDSEIHTLIFILAGIAPIIALIIGATKNKLNPRSLFNASLTMTIIFVVSYIFLKWIFPEMEEPDSEFTVYTIQANIIYFAEEPELLLGLSIASTVMLGIDNSNNSV